MTDLITNQDCVFCKIIRHEIPANVRFEDDEIIAFDDINPSAPIHVLVIPKVHIPSLTAVGEGDQMLLGKLVYRAKLLADQLNIAEPGYRVSINVGKWGGQIVPHLHLHILGGVPLSEIFTEAEATSQMVTK
ncbi:MAG: histidine triad nucleotide-binding protein [Patescibacteria group bacterium]